MVAALKDLAAELGQTPTRGEFTTRSRFTTYQVISEFKNYARLCGAAGIATYAERKRGPLPNSIFERELDTHLEAYVPREIIAPTKRKTLAAISDIHWPFHMQRVLDRFFRHCDDHKPEVIALVGDAWDMYSHAKFPRSLNVFTPREEEDRARAENVKFWETLRRACPDAECIQLLGNHDMRAVRRTLESMPTLEHWIEAHMRSLFSFEGVRTVMDPREEIFVDDVMLHHGHMSKLGDHRDHALHNVIVGHTHRPGIVYRTIRGGVLFEMNLGYAGDPEAKGLSYTPQKITGWVHSFGAIDEDGPRIVLA